MSECQLDALLLDPEHRRQKLPLPAREWLQTHIAECFAQLAVYAPGKEALLKAEGVTDTLQHVADKGLSSLAKDFASNALMALSDKQLNHDTEGQLHVMLSCEPSLSSLSASVLMAAS